MERHHAVSDGKLKAHPAPVEFGEEGHLVTKGEACSVGRFFTLVVLVAVFTARCNVIPAIGEMNSRKRTVHIVPEPVTGLCLET